MFYSRVLLKNSNGINKFIEENNYHKVCDFAFYDLVYENKNGNSITDDTLKIRVYQINDWNTKNVLVILKKAVFNGKQKEDKTILNEEFDTEEEAIKFVEKEYGSQYSFVFKLEKTGIQYEFENTTIWLENIVDLGISAEIGSDDTSIINKIIDELDVVEKLDISVPEYMYNKVKKKK